MSTGNALVLAVFAELVYSIARRIASGRSESAIAAELAVTALRVCSIVALLLLVRRVPPGGPARAGSSWAVGGLMLAELAFMPPLSGSYRPSDAEALVYMATAPFVAVREELFYRRILIPGLEGIAAPGVALAISVAAFVVSHVGVQTMSVVNVSALLTMGIVLGAIWQVTRRLWPLIAFHLLYDVVAALPYYELFPEGISTAGNIAMAVIALAWRQRALNNARSD